MMCAYRVCGKEKKRREKKRETGVVATFMVTMSLSIHVSNISKGHEKFDSESLHSTFKCLPRLEEDWSR